MGNNTLTWQLKFLQSPSACYPLLSTIKATRVSDISYALIR